jgi:Gon7 family
MAVQPSKILTAVYSSPDEAVDFKHSIKTACSVDGTVHEKIAYLGKLRESTKILQEQLNGFLTKKMEEDKAQAGQSRGERSKAQDEIEEENYGEEAAEDD